ncbi:CDP-alcohol phosphatidyltransferase family protein [Granulibacter bethesdensis]|uniref:CDP-diacylglycerol--glycerol-3-phosphate 3-phosphatidyltransferase n=2 Tax=Granulibacter bethesdensis TaxID=364410 RepID=Q0BQG8_GRABC|nr:CDP-alcohol phosphatidyltransferase family protein [Granulibacter bethesdensis]ABI62934.1 CDP-diacylglycerol--glycerol-3-phosphate 3-phosphatidyltransferase [Granulibacter bethesdensis CGDNIH1]APH52802.1 CDP-diacylglycerol--glycerol-3-phosphate 3-phosphatidyltransferase [Granulibacter bethesdensis]APH65490.1 CDP-diacylglycerol--glycerol-3-phosphate 3-phosphatidyltransferase [Granulibacter bethesdensis]
MPEGSFPPDQHTPDHGGNMLPPPDHALFTLPNIITFGRLCAVPFAVWLVLRHDFAAAFWLFVAAGLSDAIDGWLARRRGPTVVGAALDPVADKALLVGMYVMLSIVGLLPDWLAILVVFRDILILGGIVVLTTIGQDVAISPLYVSKLNTTLQIILVAFLLATAAFAPPEASLVAATNTILVVLVALSTLASGAAYVWMACHPR